MSAQKFLIIHLMVVVYFSLEQMWHLLTFKVLVGLMPEQFINPKVKLSESSLCGIRVV